MDISRVIAESKTDIKALNVRVGKNDVVTFSVSFEVDDTTGLNYLCSKIRQVEGVLDIDRTKG